MVLRKNFLNIDKLKQYFIIIRVFYHLWKIKYLDVKVQYNRNLRFLTKTMPNGFFN